MRFLTQWPLCAALLAAALLVLSCGPSKPLYLNAGAALDRRVDDLLGRMTLEEKVSQLSSDSPAIERLGIPAYNWWNECLHGVARAGHATVFPMPIGLAATFDARLINRMATAISDEARAKFNEFQHLGKRNIYQGLTFWSPNINLFRDPRWGRGMETYGEDPYLTGRMAVGFIRGLQGDDPKYFKTIATAKHYAVHSGPESLRHSFDARPSVEDLKESYLPQFEAAVREGGAYSVMCAYNRVDGAPACASPALLDTILRRRWAFPGYVVSDCGAVEDIYKRHKTEPTPEAGAAKALKTGTDLDCGTEYVHLLPAVKAGLISEADVNVAVRRLLEARFRLGLFDPPERVKYAQIPYAVNEAAAHAELALEAARKSVVLLKNDRSTLPLAKSLKTLAVIGPNADSVGVLLGNYNGDASAPVTVLEGIRRKVGSSMKVLYARGADLAANLPNFEVVPGTALFTSNGADRKSGLTGAYYRGCDFDGKAHRPREFAHATSGQGGETPAKDPRPLFTRVDAAVDFRWGDGSPRQDLDDDDFGVRWEGFLSAPASGTYRLGAFGMNAFELSFDGRPLAAFNSIHERGYQWGEVKLEAGKLYPVRLDYHEYLQDADIQLVWAPPLAPGDKDALEAARQADATVLVLGLSPRLEGEELQVKVDGFSGGDRVRLDLPQTQQALMEKVVALGKPTVLVLLNGSAVSVTWARDHVPAIVEAWYPGQAGGTALADVLFGDYNPAGRLPVTFYKSAEQLPPFTDYAMKGRTYRYFQGEPLFPFGHGLSYTTFAYRNLVVPRQANVGDELKVSVEVENTGSRAGDEVVQLYAKAAGAGGPIRALQGFERASLKPGEKKTVSFTLSARQLAHVAKDGHLVVEPGAYQITVGGKQPGFRGAADAATTGVETASVILAGAPKALD